MNSIWSKTKRILEGSLNPGIFQVWIKALEATEEGGQITLLAQNEFVAAWIRERLLPEIIQAAAQVTGSTPDVRVNTKPATEQRLPNIQAVAAHNGQTMAKDNHPPRQGHTQAFRFCFDQFVVGPCNALAYEASLGLCRDTLPANQLFISAGPGLGKTHLTQSMGFHLTDRPNQPTPRVIYVTAEEFSSRLILSIKMREVDRFKAYFRQNVDILILEDIHFFQGKLKLQDELLNTISTLQSRGCRVVLTSSFLPKELSGLDSQLSSRLCAGFLATIEQPDFQTRRTILERKAKVHQVLLPNEVANLLADRLRTDIRQLESCLNNLVLKARILGQAITMDLAWDVLKNYQQDNCFLDLDHIVEYICRAFDIKPDHLSSKSRKHNLVLARNTAFFLARKHTTLSLQDIGVRFNRKHSTVVKGITAVEQHLSLQTPLGRQIETTIEKLGA